MNQINKVHEFNNKITKLVLKDKNNNCFKFSLNLIDLLNDNNHRLFLFVLPDGFNYERMFLYYQAIFKLYMNCIDEERKIFDELEIDDLILYEKKKFKIVKKLSSIDMEKISKDLSKNNERYIVIEDKTGAIEYICESKSYLLTPYNGDSSSLSQIGKKSKKYKGIDNLIIDVFDLKNRSYNTLVNETMLFVTSKNQTEQYINDVHIDFGGEITHLLTEVISTSYYSNYDNEHRFRGNNAQKKSILKMASNLETAYELMKINKEVNSFTIKRSDSNGFNENTLIKILSRKQLEKGLVIANYSELDELESLLNNKEIKTNIIGKFEIDSSIKDGYVNEQVYQNFTNKEIIIEEVDFENDILFVEAYQKIKRLSNYYGEKGKISQIIRLSYSILKSLKGYVHIVNGKNDLLLSKIMTLKTLFKESSSDISKVESELIHEIIEIQNLLFSSIKRVNPLFKIVDYKIRYSSQDILFILPNSKMFYGLNEKYNSRKGTRRVIFKTLDMIKANEFYDEIIIFSIKYGSEYQIFSLNNSSKITIFEYPHRKKNIEFLLRKYLKKLGQIVIEANYDENSNELNDINDEKRLESMINRISSENSMDYFFDSINLSEVNNRVSCSIFIDCDNYFGFFSENYKIYSLDRINKELISKEAQCVKNGDELIFLSEEFREGDFLEGVISKLLENKQFEGKYGDKIRISKLWSEQLLLIKKRKKLTYKELANLFKNEGIQVTPGAISNWVNSDYLVGTKEKDVYRVISNYSYDEYYKNNWEKVYDACNEIRSMHIKLRHELANEMINGFTVSQDSNNILRYLPLGKENFVGTSTVSSIINRNVQLPYSIANKMRMKGD